MKRPLVMVLLLWFGLCATVFGDEPQAEKQPLPDRQPNIIVILADDLGYGETGCQGCREIPTPHIDRLAAQGVRFTQAYVTAPNCSPSRAGLLTGRVPTRFGYEFNPVGARNEEPHAGLPPEELTIAEALKDVGYTTGIIGKWHLGGSAAYHPLRHGFDEFYGFLHEGHYFVPPPWRGVTTMLRRKRLPGNRLGRQQFNDLIYTTHMGHNEPDYDANNPLLRQSQPVKEIDYLTDAIAREAVSFIDRHHDKPFFLYIPFNAVHSPLQATNADLERFASIKDIHRRIFAGMLSRLDTGVGRILEALARRQLDNQTLIVFLSDNGGPTRELTSSNRPLRGEKSSMYEGGLRVPMILRWPGRIPAGRIENRAVWSVDLFPTFAGMAGAPLPREKIDGVDLLPALKTQNDQPIHRELFWRQGPRTAIRAGDWKLVRSPKNPDGPQWELYNIADDPGEQQDLAGKHPDRVLELENLWHHWNDQMRSPRF